MIRGRSRVFPILVPALALALAGWVPFPGWAGTCDPPVARAVSVQGRVEAQSAGESSWRPLEVKAPSGPATFFLGVTTT